MPGLPDFMYLESFVSQYSAELSQNMSSFTCQLHEKHSNTAGKMAQWVRVSAAKADGGRREPAPTGCPLTSSCVLGHKLTLVVSGRSDQVVGAWVE